MFLSILKNQSARGPISVMKAGGRWSVPFFLPVCLGLLWYLASKNGWVSAQILPSPAIVWTSALDLAQQDLVVNMLVSLRRLFTGLLLGMIAGVTLGTAIGLSSRIERLILPFFSALAQIPTLAWIPLFMLWFGIEETLKIVVVVKAVIVPMTFHTATGVRDIPSRLQEASAVLRLSPVARIRYLVMPAVAPSIIAGSKTALGTAWSSLLAVELLASSNGLGYLMVWGRQLFMLDIVMVCICVIALIGILMDKGVNWIDRTFVHWPQPTSLELRRKPLTGIQHVEPWLVPAVFLVMWWTGAEIGVINSNILVSPATVVAKLSHGLADGTLTTSLYQSLHFTLSGLLVGGATGVIVGIVAGMSRTAESAMGGTLSLIRHVAIFAWVPLITAWLGLGDASKVAFIALACFSPLYVATQAGIANLSPQLNEAACVLRLGLWHRMTKLILPGALSTIFSGLRVALIYAWLATIGAEYFITTTSGIGSFMISAQQLFKMDDVMAAMVLIGLTGAGIHKVGMQIEKLASRWRFE